MMFLLARTHPQRRYAHISKQLVTMLCLLSIVWPAELLYAASHAAPMQQETNLLPPSPVDDFVTTEEDTPITIDVLENDEIGDEASEGLILAEVDEPLFGTAEIIDNKIVYTPTANENGFDTFFYTVHNGDLANTRTALIDIEIEPVNDAPSDILLNGSTISESTEPNSFVGFLDAVDVDLALGDEFFTFSIADGENNNDFFALLDSDVELVKRVSFAETPTLTLGVEVSDSAGATFRKDIVITVTDENDPPTAINLSNDRIDENQSAGATVGTLSTVDPDTPNDHVLELVGGSGSADNDSFTIDGTTLKTTKKLDFETKPTYSIRVSSTDIEGADFEQTFVINLNNIPQPPDDPPNTLSFCSGNTITLIERTSSRSSRRVLVEIDDITISNKTADSCRVDGDMNITTNGDTIRNLRFSGQVNARNQFSSSSIEDFNLSLAGVSLEADNVEITYNNEQANLHITRPKFRMPRELGGSSAIIPLPTLIDSGGIKFIGSTRGFKLPVINTSGGLKLNLTGSLRAVADGFEIDADGELEIPSIRNRRSCSISAGVTISVDVAGNTVLAIEAGESVTAAGSAQAGSIHNAMHAPYLPGQQPVEFLSPEALDSITLDRIRARASCNPGLPIGNTGLVLTNLGGEIRVSRGRERVDLDVTIQTVKRLPRIGPIVEMRGDMGFQPRPFELDLGVALEVLSFNIARANASIRRTSFRGVVEINSLFIGGRAEVNLFEKRTRRSTRLVFTGSGRVSVRIVKGSLGSFCCLLFDAPIKTRTLARVGVDVGEFTTGDFGVKGIVEIIGINIGVFVGSTGRFAIGRVSRFQLVRPLLVNAARTAMLDAIEAHETSELSAASLAQVRAQYRTQGDYTFLEDANGKVEAIVIRAPLTKPAVDAAQIQAAGIAASDVITKVNLIQHGDTAFVLESTAPLTLTLITPNGQEVSPANYMDAATLGYTINYTHSVDYIPESRLDEKDEAADQAEIDETKPQLLFTALSSDPNVTNVDLRIDGKTIYYDITPEDTAWLTPVVLSAGEHSVQLVKHGTDTVTLDATVNLEANTNYSLVSIGGSGSGLGILVDDRDAPEVIGKAKVRLVNRATSSVNMIINGTPFFSNVPAEGRADFALIDPGPATIEFRDSQTNALLSNTLNVDLNNGDVYTFFTIDDTSTGAEIRVLQRTDARYTPVYQTYYAIDQATMNEEWEMKLVGDTDNTDYRISVFGPDTPPILGSVMIDTASPLDATRVSWQLTSDNRPTTVSLYANTEGVTTSIPITNTDGTTTTEEIPNFTGLLLDEFVIEDVAELGGQLITKEIDLSDLESGTYNIWVRADDTINPPVNAYATSAGIVAASANMSVYGINAVRVAKDDFDAMAHLADAVPITIDHAADFPVEWTPIITPTFNAETNELDIAWAISSHPDVDSYNLLVGNAPLSVTQIITVGGALVELDENGADTGRMIGSTVLHDIRPDTPYFFSIEAVDTDSGRAVRAQEVPFSVASPAFAITTSQPTVNVVAGQNANVPITLSAEEALFFPNVWLSTNLGDTPLGVTAAFVDRVEGFPGLNAEEPTQELEIRVDASVAAGTYPVSITGYNGEKEEALSFDLVVSAATESPVTQPADDNVFLPLVIQ